MTKIAAGKDLDDATMTLNDVDKVMTKLGLSLKDGEGQIRDLGEVLDEVGAKWNTFTRNEQNQLATAIAGTRQANFFRSAMGSWDEVLSGTEAALNSTGGATERMAIYTESLEGKLNTLQATWEEFVLNLQASDAFKSLIDLGTKLISLLDLVLNKIPILSNLIKTVLVVGAINVLIGTIGNLIKLMGKSGVVGTLLNVGTTLTGLKSAATEFSTGMQLGFNSATSFGAALQNFVKVTDSTETGLGKLALSLGSTAEAAGLAGVGIGQVALALAPIAAVAAAVVGIGLAVWFNSAEKAAKDAQDAISDFNEKQQNLETAQSQLDTINDKIAEINAKDGLTLTDKQELIRLKEQRAELESIIELKKQAALSSAKEAAPDIQEAFTKSYGSDAGQIADFGKDTAIGRLQTASQGLGGFSAVLGAYKELTRRQEEAAAGAGEFGDAEQKALDTATEKVQAAQEELTGYRDTLQAAKDLMSDDEWQSSGLAPLLDSLNTQLGAIEQVTAPEAWQGHKLTELLLGDDVSQTVKNAESQIDELKQQLADGIIDEDTYKEKLIAALNTIASDPDIQEGLKNIFPDLDLSDNGAVLNTLAEVLDVTIPSAAEKTTYSIKDIDSGLADLDDRLDTLKDGVDNLGSFDWSSINDIDDFNEALAQGEDLVNSYENELDSLQSAYDSLGANVDAAGAALDFLASNMDDIVNSGEAGYKAVSDVISGAGQLVDVIDTATGEVINIQDRIEAIMTDETLTQQQKQAAVVALQGDIQNAGNNTITTMNAVITAIVKVKQELAAALNAAASFVDKAGETLGKIGNSVGGKVVSGLFGISTDDINAAVQGLSNGADTLRQKSQEITASIKNDQAELIKQTQAYQAKLNSAGNAATAAYDKVGSAAKKSGSSGSKSTKDQTDATKELTDALKEEYEAQKAILDAQKKQLQARKEALAQEKSDLADAKDAIENLIDLTMKMLKQQYQDQLDLLEKQADALDDQADAFEKKVEQQKEFLKLQKEEQEHADELAEKNQAIADVQAQLEELKYDNSADAQKKRLELLDDLNSAQKDLTDYQNDYDYDTKLDELDKEKDAFQQQIDAQKEAIDQQKEYIKNTLMDEYNLYQEAIALIQGRSDEFYQSLVNWNRIDHRCE